MTWIIVSVANGIVACAYFAIAWAILRPLARSRQLTVNRLGVATGAIFLTCAVHHGGHTVHMVLPAFGIDKASGLAMRQAFQWHQALWDVITASVGVYYWTLRRTYGSLMQGAKLFDDMQERQRQALEINDNIVQGLAVAQMALALDQQNESKEALEATLAAARRLITDLLGEVSDQRGQGMHAGSFVRSSPAQVKPQDTETP